MEISERVTGPVRFCVAGAVGLCILWGFRDCDSGRHEQSGYSRARGCMSNQNSIDKCIGVWESQRDAVPIKRDLWIELLSDGSIGRVSKDVEVFNASLKLPANEELKPGSKVLFNYTKDLNLFRCPARWNELADRGDAEVQLAKQPEVHYRWICGPLRRPELGGRTRGTVCVPHGEAGEPGDPELRHRPDAAR